MHQRSATRIILREIKIVVVISYFSHYVALVSHVI